MLRKALVTSLLLMLIVYSNSSFSYEGWYLNLSIQSDFREDSGATINGSSIGDISHDTGYGFGSALGYSFFENQIRIEGEVSYRTADVGNTTSNGTMTNSGEIDVYALMTNILYDVYNSSNFIPYIGAGLGFGFIADDNDDDTQLAYQFLIGTNYAIADGQMLNIGYRYFGMADPEIELATNNTLNFDFSSHLVEVGYRIPLSNLKHKQFSKKNRQYAPPPKSAYQSIKKKNKASENFE